MKNSKKWQTATGVLIVAGFVAVSLLSVPVLSLVSVAFGYGGGGGAAGDTMAPIISNIEAVVSDNDAVITWGTHESSISWVVYGTDTDYGSEVKTTSYTVSHSVTLGDLVSGTTYHYQVKSKDSSGNIGTYTDKTFTTTGEAGEVVEEDEEEGEAGEEEGEGDGEAEEEKPISEMTIPELQAKIVEITALIAQLQAQLAGTTVAGCTITSFDRNLSQGMAGDDVKCLQIVLNTASDTQIADSGVGSPGSETTYFGPLTKAGVIKFQEKYADEILASWGLTSGTGLVGSTTRAKLNQILAE
ncbi:hypothetical protein KAS79_02065 [Candidatus Parcubacteria bacterium]|nr:hypothetical protein [Candidatus Parcubacteria bacterium]